MYDFDMSTLLGTFNNDPEALAAAFTSQLNDELNHRKQEAELNSRANSLVAFWNSYLDDYGTFYNKDLKDFHIKDGNELITFINLLLDMMPEVEKYVAVLDNVANQ